MELSFYRHKLATKNNRRIRSHGARDEKKGIEEIIIQRTRSDVLKCMRF